MRASCRSTRSRRSPSPASSRSSPARTRRRDAFSTGRHENRLDDPDDTVVLDDVVRFVGQRVAAVVADSEAAAEEGCRRARRRLRAAARRLRPRGGDGAGRAGASTSKGRDARIREPERNIVAEIHGEHRRRRRRASPQPTSSTRATYVDRSASSTPSSRRTAPSAGSTSDGRLVSAPARRCRS